MNEHGLERKWLEASWRGKLSPTEEAELRAWLAAHPLAQADWEAETTLTDALGGLPQAPLPSNFTARVLDTVERETWPRPQPSRWREWAPWHWRWLPRAAFFAIVAAGGVLAFHHLRDAQQEKFQYARSVVALSRVESLPGPAILENFDAIRALDQTPGPDQELLKLLQ
jgi:anti-sigma factor RsiW